MLLHLPLKHLLPEFMDDTTRFPNWIRRSCFLVCNIQSHFGSNFQTFYLQSHFQHCSSTSVCPSRLANPSADAAALWHHVLPTFPSSVSTSSLHSYLTLLLTFLTSTQLIVCSLPPFLSCTSLLQMPLPCFLHFLSLEVPRFPQKTLQRSCCIFKVPPDFSWILSHICQCLLQTVQLWFGITLCHEWQKLLMTVVRGKVWVKGNWDFPRSFYWRKLQGTKKQGGGMDSWICCLLGIVL